MRWAWLLFLVCLVQSTEALSPSRPPLDDVNTRPILPVPMTPPPNGAQGGHGVNESLIRQFVSIPNFRNRCLGQATAELQRLGLRWQVTTKPHSQPSGTVIDQNPLPNTAGYRGQTTVELIVAQQPDYRLTLNAEKLRLTTNSPNRLTARINPPLLRTNVEYHLLRNGMLVNRNNNGSFQDTPTSPDTYSYSAIAKFNHPACGKEFNLLTLSSNPIHVIVDTPQTPEPPGVIYLPDVRGLCRAQAEQRLRKAGVGYITSGQVSREPIDRVLSQSPLPGQYRPGELTRIHLIVAEQQRPNLFLRAERTSLRAGEPVRLTADIDPPLQTGRLEFKFFRNGRFVATSSNGFFQETIGRPAQYSYHVETVLPVNRCGQEFATLPLRSPELLVRVGTGDDSQPPPHPPPPSPPPPPPDDLILKIVIPIAGILFFIGLIRLFRRGRHEKKRRPKAQPDELHIHLDRGLHDMQADLERPVGALDCILVVDAGEIEIEKHQPGT